MQFRVVKYPDLFSTASVVTLNGAAVFNDSWVILNGDQVITPDVSHHTSVVDGRPWTEMDRIQRGESISLVGLSAVERISVDQAIFVGGSSNYYHFTVDYLGNLANVCDSRDIPLIVEQNFEWQKDLLAAYGFDANNVVTAEGPALFEVDRLVVPEAVLDRRGVLRGLQYPKWVSERTRHISPAESFERIYVSRKRARNRSVENEEEIFDYLQSNDFRLVIPEELTVEEQISIFKAAKFIIGPTGTNLSNLIYSRSGANLIELMPSYTWIPSQIRYLAAGFGICYQAVPCQGSFDDVTFQADLEALKKTMCDDMGSRGVFVLEDLKKNSEGSMYVSRELITLHSSPKSVPKETSRNTLK